MTPWTRWRASTAARAGWWPPSAPPWTRAGLDRTTLRPADLAPVDEFHIRGRAASLEIVEALDLTADSHVLDLGSGLGGPARTLAELTGCTVTGVDLTPEFCEVATALSEWTGLSDRTRFQVGDATATGLPDAAVDAALTVHVAMNIADKPALYAEAFRVLRPGGTVRRLRRPAG